MKDFGSNNDIFKIRDFSFNSRAQNSENIYYDTFIKDIGNDDADMFFVGQ